MCDSTEHCLFQSQFQVKPSDSKYISIELIEQGHGLNKYRVRFLKDFPPDEHFYVMVYSPETNQNIEVSEKWFENV